MATKLHILDSKTLLFLCVICALSWEINAQISMREVYIPDILTIGTYSQLIESLGYPNSQFASTINPINPRCLKEGMVVEPKDTIQCEYLVYDAYEYIRVGDSVQLVFVDLRKSKVPITIMDLVINKKITQKKFLSEITKKGWWSEEQSHYKIGRIESHYYTYSKVKKFGVDFKEDPYSSVVFTFYDRLLDIRIWWIEFPIMRIGSIIH